MRRGNFVRVGKAYSEAEKQFHPGEMSEMRQRADGVQQRGEQGKLQRLWNHPCGAFWWKGKDQG